jgi:hypothetical protein
VSPAARTLGTAADDDDAAADGDDDDDTQNASTTLPTVATESQFVDARAALYSNRAMALLKRAACGDDAVALDDALASFVLSNSSRWCDCFCDVPLCSRHSVHANVTINMIDQYDLHTLHQE